jgi:hypothetical protein
MTYLQLINENADETAQKNNELIAVNAELTLQGCIITAKQSLNMQAQQLNIALRAIPFNAHAIYNATTKVDLLNRELTAYQKMLVELFPVTDELPF